MSPNMASFCKCQIHRSRVPNIILYNVWYIGHESNIASSCIMSRLQITSPNIASSCINVRYTDHESQHCVIMYNVRLHRSRVPTLRPSCIMSDTQITSPNIASSCIMSRYTDHESNICVIMYNVRYTDHESQTLQSSCIMSDTLGTRDLCIWHYTWWRKCWTRDLCIWHYTGWLQCLGLVICVSDIFTEWRPCWTRDRCNLKFLQNGRHEITSPMWRPFCIMLDKQIISPNMAFHSVKISDTQITRSQHWRHPV